MGVKKLETGIRHLQGADKAAILMLAFGEELAAEIFKSLSEHEVRRISQALSRLGRVDQETINQVLVEFGELLESVKQGVSGGRDTTRRILERAFGANGETTVRELGLDGPPALSSLERVEPKPLAAFLAKEQPQTGAVVLAHLDAKRAGETLRHLPVGMREEILMRLAVLEQPSPEVLEDLNEVIEREVASKGQGGNVTIGGPEAIAAVLNGMDQEAADRLLESIEERDPELAARVRESMFRFEDLPKLPDRGIQTLLTRVPQKTLRLALRGASDGVMEAIMRNLSPRAAALLKEDLETMGKVRRDEVEEARAEVLRIAREMEKEGVLSLRSQDEVWV